MPFFKRDQEEIVADFLRKLSVNTNFTQLVPGSKVRFFLDTVSEDIASEHSLFDANLLQPFIRYCDGRFLDFFGDMLNLSRVEAAHAITETENFYWYVDSGIFGDINAGSDIYIAAGETVSTVPLEGNVITPGIETQPTIEYKTIEAVTLGAKSSYAYVPIRAIVEGSASDVPRNVLNKHTFSNYVQAQQGLLKCTNKYAISTGDDRETDTAYRFRLLNIFRARYMAVLASIRLAALSVSGVSDIIDVECEQGPGTYSIYVQGLTPTTSNRLLQEVINAVSNVSSHGVRPFVLAPQPIGMEFVASVFWSPRATNEQIAAGYAAMRDALEREINNLDIGQALEISDLIDILINSTPFVLSIGSNKPNTFEEVYIHRTDPLGESTIRTLLASDKVEPLYNERIILETSGRYRGIQFLTRS